LLRLGCGSGKRGGGGEIRFEFWGEAVAGLQPDWIIPGELDGAVGGFGYEDFERQIERGGGSGEHDGCTGFGASEDEEAGGWHGKTSGGGFAGVVDDAEELDAFFFEQGFEARDGFVDGVMTGESFDAFLHGGFLS